MIVIKIVLVILITTKDATSVKDHLTRITNKAYLSPPRGQRMDLGRSGCRASQEERMTMVMMMMIVMMIVVMMMVKIKMMNCLSGGGTDTGNTTTTVHLLSDCGEIH